MSMLHFCLGTAGNFPATDADFIEGRWKYIDGKKVMVVCGIIETKKGFDESMTSTQKAILKALCNPRTEEIPLFSVNRSKSGSTFRITAHNDTATDKLRKMFRAPALEGVYHWDGDTVQGSVMAYMHLQRCIRGYDRTRIKLSSTDKYEHKVPKDYQDWSNFEGKSYKDIVRILQERYKRGQ